MIFKCNGNEKSKLIDLWKFRSLIELNYKFHTQWNLERKKKVEIDTFIEVYDLSWYNY